MSRSIRDLEHELGVVLFERSKTGMTLTHAGEVLVRRARAIQAEFQRTQDEMARFKGAERGTTTIACSGAGLLEFVPPIMRQFHRRFPNVRLKILEGTFPVLETDIRDGLIDLYFGPVAKGFYDSALTVEPLLESGRIIIGRRGHPLAAATSLKELIDAAWVTTPVMIDIDNEVNSLFVAAGLPTPRIIAQAASSMALSTIVATSDLLAPVPKQWMSIIRETNLLIRIPVQEFPNAVSLCAVRRANMPLTPAAEFVSDLASRAAGIFNRSHASVKDTAEAL
jgi:DNA-binding transcriptional LysR family regulator